MPTEKNKTYGSIVATFILLLFMTSCAQFAPCGFDKDQYIDNFKSFIREAEDTRTDEREAVWTAMDDRFTKLSEECYEQWEDELSLGQKAKIAGWVLKYQYIRVGKPIIDPDK